MGTLVIPDLDDETFARLRAEALAHGRGEADEARRILSDSLKRVDLAGAATESLADAMRAIFEPLGGHDFPNVRERGSRPPPDFSDPDYDA